MTASTLPASRVGSTSRQSPWMIRQSDKLYSFAGCCPRLFQLLSVPGVTATAQPPDVPARTTPPFQLHDLMLLYHLPHPCNWAQ